MVSARAIAPSTQDVTLPHIPELYDPNFLDVLIPHVQPEEPVVKLPTPHHPMIDALQATTHHTYTENLAPTLNSTLSPTLNAFHLLPSARSYSIFKKCLDNAWSEDPLLTLRIIWNIRSIHDGKGQKELFYRAFGWLYENHPRTAISNIHLLVEPVCVTPKKQQRLAHGYWKDLLNILVLATIDELNSSNTSDFLHFPRQKYTYPVRREKNKNIDSAERIKAALTKAEEDRAAAHEKRKLAGAHRHEILLTKIAEPRYRALYVAVARLFSDRLGKDLHVLEELEALASGSSPVRLRKKISLAGKWAPTPHGSHDRHTNIATAIGLVLRHAQTTRIPFPAVLNTPHEPREGEAAIVLRSFYQRWVLTPLRKAACIPEPLMSANRWTEIKYNRVSSICMKNNTDLFYARDPDGFQMYLISVESGRKTISGATLLPHELVSQALMVSRDNRSKYPALAEFRKSSNRLRVVEAQWKTMIERLRESGTIKNALAICDVSGSMGSLHGRLRKEHVPPIFPAVSLSLVLAHLATPPFDSGFITFSHRPQFIKLDLANKSLVETVTEMTRSNCGMSTDLNAVFLKLLLPLAVKNGLKQEEMIKRLFIFSDMQFDNCGQTGMDGWETNYDVIEKAYKAAGYEVPQIVYWDLAACGTVEVAGDRKGVALMNGFSPAMLKVFMGEEEPEEWESVGENGETETVVAEEFNPINIMRKAVMRKSFDGLVVLD